MIVFKSEIAVVSTTGIDQETIFLILSSLKLMNNECLYPDFIILGIKKSNSHSNEIGIPKAKINKLLYLMLKYIEIIITISIGIDLKAGIAKESLLFK